MMGTAADCGVDEEDLRQHSCRACSYVGPRLSPRPSSRTMPETSPGHDERLQRVNQERAAQVRSGFWW